MDHIASGDEETKENNTKIFWWITIGFIFLVLLIFVVTQSLGISVSALGWSMFGLTSALSEDSENNNPIGFEYVDSETLHFWNEFDNYYLNMTSGIQFSNYYDEYWTHNVFCAGYKTTEWNYLCSDNLPIELTAYSDNTTFVKINGTRVITIAGRNIGMGIEYNLNLTTRELEITTGLRHLSGASITNDLAFAWRSNNIKIDNNYENDRIFVNNTNYNLNESLDLLFKNMTIKEIRKNRTWNGNCSEDCLDADYLSDNPEECSTCWDEEEYDFYNQIPFYKIQDDSYVKLRWKPNLNYFLQVKSNDQFNAPVTLAVVTEGLDIGEQKQTTFYWKDPTSDLLDDLLSYWKLDDASGNALDVYSDNDLSVNGASYGETGIIEDALGFITNDYAEKDVAIVTSPPYTISLWWKPADDSTDSEIFYIGNKVNQIRFYAIGSRQDGSSDFRTRLRFADSEAGHHYLWGDIITPGEWVHIVVRITSSTDQDLFTNGNKADGNFGDDESPTNDRIAIGALRDSTPSNYANGDIDEVGIWERALTDVEIDELYGDGTPPSFPFGDACNDGVCEFHNPFILEDISIANGDFDSSGSPKDSGLQMKWNLNELCNLEPTSIDSAILQLYIKSDDGIEDEDARIWFIENETWIESDSGANIEGHTTANQTDSTFSSITEDTYSNITITDAVSHICNNEYNNLSFRIEDIDHLIGTITHTADNLDLSFGLVDGIAFLERGLLFGSKETSPINQRPKLFIEYTEAVAESSINISIESPANNTYREVDQFQYLNCTVNSSVDISEVTFNITKFYGGAWFKSF